MATVKKLNAADRLLEAMGSHVANAAAPSPQSPQQLALRRLWLVGGGLMPADLESSVAEMEKEFAEGRMPDSRKEICALLPMRKEGPGCTHPKEPHAQRLRDLSAAILSERGSTLNWTQASAWAMQQHLDAVASQRVAAVEKAARQPLRADEGPSILHAVLKNKATKAALATRGGIPRAALGADPARAVFLALQPSSRYNNNGFAAGFVAALKELGVDQERSPSKSGSTPVLMLILNELQRSSSAAESQKWMEILEKAPETPWLQFDAQAAVWRGQHPLWALAQAVNHYSDAGEPRWAQVAQGFVKMGYKPDGSMPEGRGQKMGEDAQAFAKSAPNALWAFANAEMITRRLDQLFALFLQTGADWTQKAKNCDERDPIPLLARLNKRARNFSAQSQPEHLAAVEGAFAAVVRAGANPLDALPPPSVKEAAPGQIRSMVEAKIEQRQLSKAISDRDLEEALQLLAEKRARQAEEAAQKAAAGGAPPPSKPRANRL